MVSFTGFNGDSLETVDYCCLKEVQFMIVILHKLFQKHFELNILFLFLQDKQINTSCQKPYLITG